MKKIAIPIANGSLAMHFGHCENFALLSVDMDAKKILSVDAIDSPPHEPGLLPRFLAEKGANMIIAGGMGSRAQQLFIENGIDVVVGAPSETPEVLVNSFLAGTLEAGVNMCDH
jgi:predicted Fe-Mo cluster-binding NifX family protein